MQTEEKKIPLLIISSFLRFVQFFKVAPEMQHNFFLDHVLNKWYFSRPCLQPIWTWYCTCARPSTLSRCLARAPAPCTRPCCSHSSSSYPPTWLHAPTSRSGQSLNALLVLFPDNRIVWSVVHRCSDIPGIPETVLTLPGNIINLTGVSKTCKLGYVKPK